MKKLYVCDYPYVLYKVLIERMGDEENSYSLILSDAIADLEPMVPVLRRSGLFEQVEFFPSEPYKDYYQLHFFNFPTSHIKKALLLLKNQFTMSLRQKGFKDITFPFELDLKQYDKIICTDFPCVFNGYLSANHVDYAISEHANNAFQNGMASKQYSLYMFVTDLLDRFHVLIGTRAASRFCKEIIVNDSADMDYYVRHKKVTEWNVDEHIKALDAQQRDRIFQLYAEAYGVKINVDQTYDLLLANPLYRDSYLPSEESQIKLYRDLIQKHFKYPVLIKSHPRDTVDYKKYFPECVVIDKNISSEVLNFNQNLKLGTVLTVCSTTGASFQSKAEKLIVLEEDYPLPASQMESLKPYR